MSEKFEIFTESKNLKKINKILENLHFFLWKLIQHKLFKYLKWKETFLSIVREKIMNIGSSHRSFLST